MQMELGKLAPKGWLWLGKALLLFFPWLAVCCGKVTRCLCWAPPSQHMAGDSWNYEAFWKVKANRMAAVFRKVQILVVLPIFSCSSPSWHVPNARGARDRVAVLCHK